MRLLLFVSILALSLCAQKLELEIADAAKTKEQYDSYRKLIFGNIRASEEDILKSFERQKLFAGATLEKNLMAKSDIEVIVEHYLFKKYMEHLFKNVKIDDEEKVLRSHYEINREKYKKNATYSLLMLKYDTIQEAKAAAHEIEEESKRTSLFYAMKTKKSESYSNIDYHSIPTAITMHLDNMEAGKLSEPIKVENKYCLVTYSGKSLAGFAEYAEVRDSIKMELAQKKADEIINNEEKRLRDAKK